MGAGGNADRYAAVLVLLGGAVALVGIRPSGFGAAALATILGPALAFALTADGVDRGAVGARR